jgi:hypothetical protein
MPNFSNPLDMVGYAVFQAQLVEETVHRDDKSPLENVIVNFDLSNLIEKEKVGFSKMFVAIGEFNPSNAKHLGIAFPSLYQIENVEYKLLFKPKIQESPVEVPV